MPNRSAYELVPSSDDDAGAPLPEKQHHSLPRRKLKLILLSFTAVVLLAALYSFWFNNPDVPELSEGGDSEKSASPQPTQLPPGEGDKGEDGNMPSGKYSVG